MPSTPPAGEQGASAWRALTPAPSLSRSATPLALGVELRRRPDQGIHQWSPRPLKAATARELVKDPGELTLTVRPLARSTATGSWIQADAGWDAVRRPSSRFLREQSRWFADLLSIARDSLLSGTAGEWLPLDPVESRLLWPHLRDATARGIPMVATQKNATVDIADTATVSVLLARAEAGGLRLTPEITLEGELLPPASTRPLGHSGVHVHRVIGDRIQLTLAEVTLSDQLHTLLSSRSPLEVPAAEEAAFFREGYPALKRGTSVRAAAGVELPPTAVPEPLLAVEFHRGDRVTFRFGWEYTGHGRFPFDMTAEAVRDAAAEAERAEELSRVWHATVGTEFAALGTLHDVEAAEFVARVVPVFEDAGVGVVVTGTRRAYHELTGEPEITVRTVESTDPDWFDLGVLVRIDGKTIPFTPLFTALSLRRTKLLLVDGSYLSLAHPALQRLRELLDETTELDEWEAGPKISRYQTALWADFEDLAHEALPAVAWRATVEALRGAEGVPAVPVPEGLRAQLRPYQQSGFEWLAFLWSHRLGGILADDMGLGKTLQLLTLMLHARELGESRPFLVVAPTSVLGTWREEGARFAPGLRVHVVDSTRGSGRDPISAAAANADLVVTSYTLVRLNEQEFADVEWAGLVLDEAQFVKNADTKQHRAVSNLRADATFAVTGTPMENSLSDLWALLKLSAPGLFPSARRFTEEYLQPIEKGKVPENAEGGEYRRRRLDLLRRRIRPLMLRRTKAFVAPDLPEKQEQLLHVELSPAHRALYDVVLQRERQKVLGLLPDLDRNRFIVFRSLTMLRMLSLSPGLIDENDAKLGSRKLDVLIERVQELQAEGHRALVFSQFTSYLDLAAERLTRAGVPYAHLDGSTRRRDDVVDGFRSGEQTVFLISLKAGGFGLTLTEADYVFLLDPWWNPAAEAQAVDRTHRIGQTEAVMVYRMISTDTIEEKVLALQQRKARLFSAVMDDESLFAQSLNADDIRALLEA